jgi:iron complex transport system permease protein
MFLPPVAFGGALLTSLLVYLLAWRQGLRPSRLILAGVAVSSFLGAMITALMIFFPDRVHSVLGFMVGGLSARTWKHLNIILPYALLGFVLVNLMARRLNILMLGDETAGSLGLHVERTRLYFIALAALLAASAVSVAGLLGFVGLIVPHMTRLIIGSDYRFLLPAGALFGAALVMICDTLARVTLDPVEVPVGIIMALLGAPFFLFLLRSRLRSG